MKYRRRDWKYVLEDVFFHEFSAPIKEGFTGQFRDCISACAQNNSECYAHPSRLFCIDRSGMSVQKDYAWDGPSGPTIDTRNSLRASLVHDVLYQAMREGGLPRTFRRRADLEFVAC